MGLPLTAAEVAALEARTEGWIAGLQLAALAMRDRQIAPASSAAFTGSNRFVVDYLADEVLESPAGPSPDLRAPDRDPRPDVRPAV